MIGRIRHDNIMKSDIYSIFRNTIKNVFISIFSIILLLNELLKSGERENWREREKIGEREK